MSFVGSRDTAGGGLIISGQEATAFDPASIPNLYAWLAGTVEPTVWPDLTGNARHLNLVSTSKVSRVARAWELGGSPAAKFYGAGGGQWADAGAAADFSVLHKVGCTAVMRVLPRPNSTQTYLLSSFGGSSSNGPGVLWYFTADYSTLNMYLSFGGNISGGSVTGLPVPQQQPITLVWRVYGGPRINVRLNGAQAFDVSANVSASNSPHPLRVGFLSGTTPSGQLLDALISDFVVYDRALSDGEVQQLEAWLATKAGHAVVPTTKALTERTPLTGTVKVMFVGDSITEGISGATSLVGGFRHRVYDLAQGFSGFAVDQIGPYIGQLSTPGFPDNQGDGYGGATIKDGYSSGPGHAAGSSTQVPGGTVDALMGSGHSYHPDVCVVLLGINDITGRGVTESYSNDNVENLITMLEAIHGYEPLCRFVVCTLTPRYPGTTASDPQKVFNKALARGVDYLRMRGLAVAVADTFSAITDPATQLADGLHPNDAGYALLGDVIWRAILRVSGYTP